MYAPSANPKHCLRKLCRKWFFVLAINQSKRTFIIVSIDQFFFFLSLITKLVCFVMDFVHEHVLILQRHHNHFIRWRCMYRKIVQTLSLFGLLLL